MSRFRRRAQLAGLFTLIAVAVALAPTAARASDPVPMDTPGVGAAGKPLVAETATATDEATGPLTAVQRKAIAGRTQVPDEKVYAHAKARATRAAAGTPASRRAPVGPKAPTSLRNWEGLENASSTPSDQTSAIGTSRYIQLVNTSFAIYNRTSDTPLSTGSLQTLVGSGTGPNVFDPQILWDPTTSRFYYVTDQINSASDNRLAFGWSKTASPTNGTTDWCKYSVTRGTDFPDYPKLGDTSQLLLIGTNTFGPTQFNYTELYSVLKPAAGTTCPTGPSLTLGLKNDLRDASNGTAWTPVPANQTDGSPTGYAVATKFPGGSVVSVFTVTKNASNLLVVGPPRSMSVAAYTTPPPAPQPGTTSTLDTLDARITQAVSAIDPFRSDQVGLWAQHTIAGGGGSQVRWYEINPTPATPVPFQSGNQSNASFFYYNGAISPDRRRNGASGTFGNGMALNYSSSSTSARIAIEAVSKVNNGAVSSKLTLKTSTGVIDDFSCGGDDVCRWGDYAGATPDPASDATADNGVVWGTNGWAENSSGSNPDWRTQNFALQVKPK